MASKENRSIEATDSNSILKGAMKERGITQIDLADKLGVIQSSISGNVNRRRIGLDVFATMLDAMEFDVGVVDRKTGEVLWKVEVK